MCDKVAHTHTRRVSEHHGAFCSVTSTREEVTLPNTHACPLLLVLFHRGLKPTEAQTSGIKHTTLCTSVYVCM